jgi:subtilisin-like proprotein convertase family protein
MIWEMSWALINQYGFDPDLYNGTGGNNLAMQLVIDGLKLQPCSPGFVDARDAILLADQNNNGGANQCAIWTAFAKRGLGNSATQGSSSSRSDGTQAFDLPPACSGPTPTPTNTGTPTNTPTPSNTPTNTPTPTITNTPAPGGTIFFDNFETNLGWTVNPNVTDTATTGQWERGNPEDTNSSGPKQLGTTVSGSNNLVTGRLAGSSAGVYDIDSGVTSVRSPNITLPSSGNITLSFSYYMAHGTNSSSADYLRVQVVGSTTQTVLEELNAANDDDAAWATFSGSLNAFANQTVYLLITAADASGASLVEAAIDDVRIEGSGPVPTNTPAPPTATPGPGGCVTYTSTNVPISLPNGTTTISSNLNISGASTIGDLNVNVTMAHVWVGDISFVLRHQDTGTAVTIIDRPGVPASTYGCSGDNIQATLSDEAASAVETQCTGTPTINGTFSPNNALSAFDGQSGNGTWVLEVTDHYTSADAGTLNGWSVEVCAP